MAAIGLVILAIAGLVALAAGLANSGSDHMVTNFAILGMDVDGSSGKIFIYGAILGAVAMLGLNMLLAGLGRGFKNKVHNRRVHKHEQQQMNEIEADRDRLAAQLEAKDRPIAIDEIDARDSTGERLTH